jgi:CubicO group peptidase (beta-lactamase class C family)
VKAQAKPMRRVLQVAAAVLATSTIGFGVWSVHVMLPRATGFAAKIACSAAFVSQRAPADIRAQELAQVGFVRVEFDEQREAVEASVWGLAKQRAVRRGLAGCTLARGELARAAAPEIALAATPTSDEPWPRGDGADSRADPQSLDRAALDAIVEAAFAEPDPAAPRHTRALLITYDGRLLAERYAEGFDATTPLPGWSMAKSVTNALVGILVERGELELEAPAPVPEWHEDSDDPRAAITLSQLLRMSSGLAFEERYGPFGEGSDMLFVDESCAALAIAQPLIAEPGTQFSYSSGTANIVARIIRDRFEDTDAQLRFFQSALFEPLGIRSATLELDPTGTFVGSSFALMNARDWARLGQLYLDEGIWQGRRILPEGWVEFTRTPAPAAPNGEYGALFQTNAGGDDRRLPSIPSDAFEMVGYEGQSVLIVPSRRAVIVRLGLTRSPARWDTDAFAAQVLATLPGA